MTPAHYGRVRLLDGEGEKNDALVSLEHSQEKQTWSISAHHVFMGVIDQWTFSDVAIMLGAIKNVGARALQLDLTTHSDGYNEQ